MNEILLSLLISLGVNIAMFVPAFYYKTDTLTDISYAASFFFVALANYLLSTKTTVHFVLLLLVTMWSFRLGTFLFVRIRKIKKDSRFDGMRESFSRFLRFWLLQGVSVFVVSLAATYVFAAQAPTLKAVSYIGAIIFGIGLLLEAVADAQKFAFNNNPSNKGKWIQSGVWSKSRHPNYLGEMLVWTGVYTFSFPHLYGSSRWLALLSPLFIYTLLLFVSGIPLLEKSADKKWGNDKHYQQYKKRVPVLFPKIW